MKLESISDLIKNHHEDKDLTQEEFEKKYELQPGDAFKTPEELGLVKKNAET